MERFDLSESNRLSEHIISEKYCVGEGGRWTD